MHPTTDPTTIGTPGQPWGPAEKAQWRALQTRRRSYEDEVASKIRALGDRFDIAAYGELDYAPDGRYPLLAVLSRDWDERLPCAVVTGGVHGYETSGVHGALQFAERHAATYVGKINLLIAPCVSPWGYERIHRWNPDALDPNRSFRAGSPAGESAALLDLVAPLRGKVLVHIDLHETTDSDETEFRPALAARDGKPYEPGEIPDGFYLVDDSEHPQRGFQAAIIEAASKVTHIAPADARGEIIGSPWDRWASARASPARATSPPPRSIPTVRAPRRNSATTPRPPRCVQGSTTPWPTRPEPPPSSGARTLYAFRHRPGRVPCINT